MNEKTGHTPGPWTPEELRKIKRRMVRASAPELLEACRYANGAIAGVLDRVDTPNLRKALENLQAAIRKAERGSE